MSKADKIVAAGAAFIAIVLFCFFAMVYSWDRSETVEAYRQRVIAQVNQALLDPADPVRQRIESAHVTVTATSARVTSCVVRTVDGGDKAGKNDRNISEVDLVITVFWEGWIQKDGFTELEILYDVQAGRVKETKFLRSNAMVNLETTNWFAVGSAIGYCLASLGD
jgi:hypothetical protein